MTGSACLFAYGNMVLNLNSCRFHLLKSLLVPLGIHIAQVILKHRYVKVVVEELHSGILYAKLCCDAAYYYLLGCAFKEILILCILAGITGILLYVKALALAESILLVGSVLWILNLVECLVDCRSASSRNAVRRPLPAIILKGAVLCRMRIADIEHFGIGMLIYIFHRILHCSLRIGAGKRAVYEIVKHIHNYVGGSLFKHSYLLFSSLISPIILFIRLSLRS